MIGVVNGDGSHASVEVIIDKSKTSIKDKFADYP